MTWYTETITEKVDATLTEKESEEYTNSFVISISTGLEAEVLTDGDVVMAYAQFPDPDSAGNYSGFECLVTYRPVVDNITYTSVADVSLWNHYGPTLKYDEGASDYFTGAAASKGPWVLVGDGTDNDIDWKNAMKKESDPNTTVTCEVTRMIGTIPASVYGDSSLRFTWGEIPGFVDIKSGVNYEVQTGFRVFQAGALSSQGNGTLFTAAWVDSHSNATGLAMTVAAASLLLAGLF